MTAQLVSEVLSLPLADKLDLVEEIWDSLPLDAEATRGLHLTAEESAELDQRAKEHLADPSSAISWETAKERIQQRFGLEL